jgi:hypothetical protein
MGIVRPPADGVKHKGGHPDRKAVQRTFWRFFAFVMLRQMWTSDAIKLAARKRV